MKATAWVTRSRVFRGIGKQIPHFLILQAINKHVVLYFHSPIVFVAWYLGTYLTHYI